MAPLTMPRLREMQSREGNRAASAERQVRDLTAENRRLRERVGVLEAQVRSEGVA